MIEKETYPMRLINLCRHKTANWEGLIFVNAKGEMQVTNGICSWPLVTHRMDSLEIVNTIDVQSILARLDSNPAGESVAELLQEDLPDFRQDMQYLSNPLLDGICYVIEENLVRIHSPHACLVAARQEHQISKDELLRKHRQVLRLAKMLHVTIYDTGISNTEQILQAKWSEYETAIVRRGALFSPLVIQAHIVQARGIHRGYANDKELSILLGLQKQIKSYDGEDCVIPCINTLYRKLVNMYDRLIQEFDGRPSPGERAGDVPATD